MTMWYNEFHPELRRAARYLPRTLITARTYRLMRALIRLHAPHRHEDVQVLTLSCGVGIRLHKPADLSTPSAALLWIHGGGYVIGTARQDDRLCHRYAKQVGMVVASVEYRLAPEYPYPAALEDCYSALKWLAALPSVDGTRVAIGGASAGGGLAAALAQYAHDRGGITAAAQLLAYPMLDDRVAPNKAVQRHYRGWTARSNRFGWASYLGDADREIAVPARRADLSGLPPAWIGVGTLDLFCDEDLAYAARLKDAGVPCEVKVVPGAFHGFDVVARGASVTRAFYDSQCAFLRDALTPTSSAPR